METSFQQVSNMNVMFGNPQGDPKNINWGKLEKQCSNIKSEFKELMGAIETRNLEDVRDALCDIHVFAYGAHHFLGLDADADMTLVVEAVLTRFCQTKEDLQATREKYARLRVAYEVHGDFPFVFLRSAFDQGDEYPKGKFLKSASYRTPVFPQP